ncbi:MAG: putative Co/Zn/Cd cation transporter, partial [Bryobacterales bacterium]|nr:putative Co/Zn/Cd cation transporter [Bryobacterales bacterium]
LTSGLAFVGISIGLLTRYPAADDWAALAASPIIVFNGLRLLRAPVAELLDTAPPRQLELEVRRIAGSVLGVVGLEKCFVRKVGFRYYVELHVLVPGHLTVREGHSLAHVVEAEILKHMPQVAKVLVHVEPA